MCNLLRHCFIGYSFCLIVSTSSSTSTLATQSIKILRKKQQTVFSYHHLFSVPSPFIAQILKKIYCFLFHFRISNDLLYISD